MSMSPPLHRFVYHIFLRLKDLLYLNFLSVLEVYFQKQFQTGSGLHNCTSPPSTAESVFDLLTHNKSQETAVYQQFMLEKPYGLAKNFSLSVQKNFPAICDGQLMQGLMQLQSIDNYIFKVTLKKLAELICEYYAVKDLDLR
jgi:hypothetical protein